MFANLDNDLTFNFITVPGSAHVEIARFCRLDNMLMRRMMINWLQPVSLLKVICLMKQRWVLATFHHQSLS